MDLQNITTNQIPGIVTQRMLRELIQTRNDVLGIEPYDARIEFLQLVLDSFQDSRSQFGNADSFAIDPPGLRLASN